MIINNVTTFHRSSLCTYIHKEHLDSSVNNISIARALSQKMKRGPAPPYCRQGLWSRKFNCRFSRDHDHARTNAPSRKNRS